MTQQTTEETTGTAPVETPAQVAGDSTGPQSNMSQADIDRIVQGRLDRQKRQFEDQYADYDDLKLKAQRLTELEQAQMSEQQRKDAEMLSLREQAEGVQRQADATLAEANERLIRAAVYAAAAQANFLNPADAYALVDMAEIAIADKGEVAGAEEAVQALAGARPYLLRKTTAPDINAGDQSPPPSDLPKLTPEQERIARRMGISLDKYQKQLAEMEKERTRR